MSVSIKNNRGFTLIEILVVMAISVVLMGLVLGPVLQSFKLTRRAQAMVDSQDAARVAMEQISRELGQAMYVYDNANAPVDLPVAQPGGSTDYLKLEYAKIDFILPKITMHCNSPNHPSTEPRDYPRRDEAWPPCPADGSTEIEARPKLPLEQDVTVVRYFLGLAKNKLGPQPNGDPDNLGWVAPWEGNVEAGSENQVVLYRAEFSPYDNELFPEAMSVVDRLADPQFFYRSGYEDHWAQIVRVVGIGKYEDLVVGTFDDSTGEVTAVEPTITFRTAAIDNDTFAGAYSSDAGFEYPDAVPTVFTGAYGYWTPQNQVVVYRDDPHTSDVQDPYEVAYYTGMSPNGDGHLVIYRWQGGVSTLEFDITDYATTGAVQGLNPDGKPLAMAFTVDPNRGAVSFSIRPPIPQGSRSISDLNPDLINQAYHDAYLYDRAGAIRYAILSTFDPGAPQDQYLPNARIVPGSERVIGPDMTPGYETTGRLVRYERVPLALGDPGLNQYKINYDTGEIYFSSVYDQDLPAVLDPAGNTIMIQVNYNIQFNRKDDVVKGDYATKSLVSIHLGMRMFDPESGKPHPVNLNKSVKVRNALR